MNRGSNVRNNFPGSIKTTCSQQKMGESCRGSELLHLIERFQFEMGNEENGGTGNRLPPFTSCTLYFKMFLYAPLKTILILWQNDIEFIQQCKKLYIETRSQGTHIVHQRYILAKTKLEKSSDYTSNLVKKSIFPF